MDPEKSPPERRIEGNGRKTNERNATAGEVQGEVYRVEGVVDEIDQKTPKAMATTGYIPLHVRRAVHDAVRP